MTEIDDRLRGYRPTGPPPDLRARILSASAGTRATTLREWLPAIAAAGLIVLFSALSYEMHARIDAQLFVPDDLRPVEQSFPDDIGGLR